MILKRWRQLLIAAICAPIYLSTTNVWAGAIPVPTQHNNNARTGANLSETVLNTTNVNVAQFGKLWSYPVDGQTYAQPLYVPNVTIPGIGSRNVVYIATMHNTVYAFDADDPAQATTPLWSVNLGPSVPMPDPNIGGACGTYKDIRVEIGILSTPVIDLATNTIYVQPKTKENGVYIDRLHALDITTGRPKMAGPVRVQASVPGTGAGSSGGMISYQSQIQNQRSALTLANGIVYVASASYCDTGPYHGWILGYNASDLTQQKTAYNTSPDGDWGGIWMAGQGASVDDQGNLYVITGNGTFNAHTGGKSYGNAFMKLAQNSNGLSVTDWFVPHNQDALNAADLDLGSDGPLLIPNTNLVVGSGKEGKIYVLNRDSFGRYCNGCGNDNQIVQAFQALGGHLHGSMVYWASSVGNFMYAWSEHDNFKAFKLTNGTFQTEPAMKSTVKAPDGMTGGHLSISANGNTAGSGIAWANIPFIGDANWNTVPGVLRAFDATDLSKELWNSQLNASRDSFGNFAKFAAPTVVNGKVYQPTFSNQVVVYGQLTNAPSGPNVALNKPTIADSQCNAGEGPEKAVNGSTSGGNADKWCSTNARWWRVDLGQSYNLTHFIVKHAGAGNEATAFNTRDFNIQVSQDGTNWKAVANVSGNIDNVTIHRINAESARYVRLNVITPASNGDLAARLYEFEVYAATGDNPPVGFNTRCASENQTCSFTGTADVVYGAGTAWSEVKQATGSITCNNANFGDRAPGILKSCYYKTVILDGATLPVGFHQIINQNSNKCVDVAGVSTANGAAIHLWDCLQNQFNQHWQFVATDSGFYRLVARHSNKVLDVAGISTVNGGLIHQWDWVGGQNQQWKASDVGGGYYKFTARHSGRCLDIPNNSTANGQQLQQFDCNGTTAQSFRIAAVTAIIVATPTALTSPTKTSSSVSLAWVAATDAAKYDVYRGGVLVGSPTTTSFTNIGLTANTAYSYTVRACNATGICSAQTAPLSVTTSASTTTTGKFGIDANQMLYHISNGWNGSWNYLCLNGECRPGTLTDGRYQRPVTVTAGTTYTLEFKVQDNATGQCLSEQPTVTYVAGGVTAASACAP